MVGRRFSKKTLPGIIGPAGKKTFAKPQGELLYRIYARS